MYLWIFVKGKANKKPRSQFDMEFRSSDGISASIAPPKDIGISLPPAGG